MASLAEIRAKLKEQEGNSKGGGEILTIHFSGSRGQ